MALVARTFTIFEFQNLHFPDYELPSSTQAILKSLSLEIGTPVEEPYQKSDVSVKRTTSSSEKERNSFRSTDRRRNLLASKRTSNSSTEPVEPIVFKTTKLEPKEGVEKQINEIRICLNKISSKNYDVQKETIFEKIRGVSVEEPETSAKIATAIFDIARSNKFYSELYATLYKELVDEFDVFREIIQSVILKYNGTIENIHYQDPNVDYDKFCEYTKNNDNRKALATFIVHLMKKGVLSKAEVTTLIVNLQTIIFDYIDQENRSNEVEEITENIFIFISQCSDVLKDDVMWNDTIRPNLLKISSYKAADHVSLTSRAVFKYMDLHI